MCLALQSLLSSRQRRDEHENERDSTLRNLQCRSSTRSASDPERTIPGAMQYYLCTVRCALGDNLTGASYCDSDTAGEYIGLSGAKYSAKWQPRMDTLVKNILATLINIK